MPSFPGQDGQITNVYKFGFRFLIRYEFLQSWIRQPLARLNLFESFFGTRSRLGTDPKALVVPRLRYRLRAVWHWSKTALRPLEGW